MTKMTKWVPETNPMILRRVGKTGEELAELSKVCSRVVIQGLDSSDPKTGISNRQSLAEEIADVLAQCECTIQMLGLDREAILDRAEKKVHQMGEWEAMFLEDENDPDHVVTPAMIKAYLEANNRYWHEADKLPSTPLRWIKGNVADATAAGLEAVLAQMGSSQEKMASASVDDLIRSNQDLLNCVQILINGCRGTRQGEKALEKWDDYRAAVSRRKDK